MANDRYNPAPPPPVAGDPLVALSSLERTVSSLRASIADLEQSPSFLMLTAENPGTMTASRLGAAGLEATALWPLLEAAGGALAEIRLDVDLAVTDDERRSAVGSRLVDRVVVGPAGWPGPHAVVDLVAEVRRRTDAIQPLVAEVDALWQSVLPRVDAAAATLDRLQAELIELGVTEPLIGRARALADDLRARLVGDPLAVVPADGDQLDGQVADAASHVARHLAGHASLADDLAAAERLLAELRGLRNQAASAGAEARTKVVGAVDLVRVPSAAVLDGPGGMAERLDRVLGRPVGGGVVLTWHQQRGLLDAWMTQADRLRTQLQHALAHNRKPLDERDELRGRLVAYRAKMAATGRAEDLAIAEVVDQVRSVLYTAPADLAQGRTLIDELARRLRS